MKHVMIDLETLGNYAGCATLSIGAVRFDPEKGALGEELYLVVNRQSCLDAGLRVDQDTLDWWEKQSEGAREVLAKSASDKIGEDNVSFQSAMIALKMFIEKESSTKVWSCGADFDLPILVTMFKLLGMEVPWKFWNGRCYRTIKFLAMWVKLDREGTYHNALDDAKYQAQHLIKIGKALRLKFS